MQQFKGLTNYGATCYINSTLQAFMHSYPSRLAVEFAPITQEVFDGCIGDNVEQNANTQDQLPEANSANAVACFQALEVKTELALQSELGTRALCAAIGKREMRDLFEQDDANTVEKKLAECLEDVYKAGQEDEDLLSLAEQQFGSLYKEPIKKLIELYNYLLISKQKQLIICEECKQESVTDEVQTDFQIQPCASFFDSLASYLKPEHLEGYKCSKCGAEACFKSICVSSIASLLIFTLNRFVFDPISYDYRKDSRPAEMPCCLDIFGLLHINKAKLEQEEQISEYLKFTCLPWFYPLEQASEPVKQAIESIPELVEYYKCYTGVETAASSGFADGPDQPEAFYSFPLLSAVPEHFYVINAVVNHTGNMQSGHYYTYINKFEVQNRRFVLYEFNDQQVTELSYPFAQLKVISGKEEAQHEADPQNMFERSISDTGYMYYYTRYSFFTSDIQTPNRMTDRLGFQLANENTEAEKTIYYYDFTVLTNYNENHSEITPFSQLNELFQPVYQFELQNYDVRTSVRSFVGQFNLEQLPFNIYQVHQTRDAIMANIKRYRKVFSSEESPETQLSLIAPKFQLSKRSSSHRVELFIEYITSTSARYDMDAFYLIFRTVKALTDYDAEGLKARFEGSDLKQKLIFDPSCGYLDIEEIEFIPVDEAVVATAATQLYVSPVDFLYSRMHMEYELQILHLKLIYALFNSPQGAAGALQTAQQWVRQMVVYGTYENGDLMYLYNKESPSDYEFLKVYNAQEFYVEALEGLLPVEICDLSNYTQEPAALESVSAIYAARVERTSYYTIEAFAGDFFLFSLQIPREMSHSQLKERISEMGKIEEPYNIEYCALAVDNSPEELWGFTPSQLQTLLEIQQRQQAYLRSGLHFEENCLIVQLTFAKPTPTQTYFSCSLPFEKLSRTAILPIPVSFVEKSASDIIEENYIVRCALESRININICSFYAISTKSGDVKIQADVTRKPISAQYAGKLAALQGVSRGEQAFLHFKEAVKDVSPKNQLGVMVRMVNNEFVDQCAFVRNNYVKLEHLRGWAQAVYGQPNMTFAFYDGRQYVYLQENSKSYDHEVLYVY